VENVTDPMINLRREIATVKSMEDLADLVGQHRIQSTKRTSSPEEMIPLDDDDFSDF